MVRVGLGVPVMKNFKGFTELMESVTWPVVPIVWNNWDTNHGVAVAWNCIIRRAIDMRVDVLFISNDDVVLHPDALDRMIPALSHGADIDLLSGANHDSDSNEITLNTFSDFSFYGIRPEEFVSKFGTFDENFYPAYFEDNDMDYRIRLLGGTMGIHEGARIYHQGSVTQFWDGEDKRVVSHQQFDENRAYYAIKWGGTPTNEQYTLPFNGITGKTPRDWNRLDQRAF